MRPGRAERALRCAGFGPAQAMCGCQGLAHVTMKGSPMHNASSVGRTEDRATSSRAVLARIRSVQPSLTHSEATVAALILTAPADAIPLGIEAVARRAGVSTATVLRFCQSLGFAGYKDFKIALAVEMGRSPAVVFEEVRASDRCFAPICRPSPKPWNCWTNAH